MTRDSAIGPLSYMPLGSLWGSPSQIDIVAHGSLLLLRGYG